MGKRLEDEHWLEQKRLEAIAKSEQQGKDLISKLEAKRLEDMAKPQKPVPKKQAKAKPKTKRMNPHELFLDPRDMRELDGAEDAGTGEDLQQKSLEHSTIHTEQPTLVAPNPLPSSPSLAPSQVPKRADKPAKVSAPMVSKWEVHLPEEPSDKAPTMAEEAQVAPELVGPSLLEAVHKAPAVKKTPPPQPKKKEKKQFKKLNHADLGFELSTERVSMP